MCQWTMIINKNLEILKIIFYDKILHFAVIIKHDTYQSFPGEGRLWIPLALKQVSMQLDAAS